MQVFTKNASQWADPVIDPERVVRFRNARACSPMGTSPILAHDSYLINPCSPREQVRERSLQALLAEVRRSEALGIDHVVLHPGAHLGEGVDRGLTRTAQALALVIEQTRGSRVCLLVENTAGQGTVLGGSFEQLGSLLRLVDAAVAPGDAPRIGLCLDTCHAFVAGYDLRTRRGFDRMLRELDSRVGLQRLRALHLNDTVQELGSHRDRHCRLGQGQLGKIPFWCLMNEPVLRDVAGVLETPPDGKDRAFRGQLAQLRALRGKRAPRS